MKLKKLLIFISAFALTSCDFSSFANIKSNLLSIFNKKSTVETEQETQSKTDGEEQTDHGSQSGEEIAPPITNYTVWFNANGGTGVMPSQKTNGSTYIVPSCSFSYDNHTFNGWALNTPSGAKYSIGSIIQNISSNITLFATWTENTTPIPEPHPISIKANLNANTYFVGDTLNTASLSASITFSDNATESYSYDDFTSNGINIKILNPNSVEVSLNSPFEVIGNYSLIVYLINYENIKDAATFEVKTNNTQVATLDSLAIHYDKTQYYEFEILDLSSLSVTLYFNNNTQELVNYPNFTLKNCAVSLFDSNNQQLPLDEELETGTYLLEVSCGDVKDSIQLLVIEETFVIGGEILSLLSNQLVLSNNNEYVSDKNRSIKIFDNYFNSGIYQAQISTIEQGFDNHLIFGYNEDDESYYSFGINMMNKPQISYFNGQNLYLLKSFNNQVNNSSIFAVSYDQETGSADFYINDSFVYSRYVKTSGNLKCGLYAGSKGCVFSNVMTGPDYTLYDNDFNNYQTANGTFENINGTFNVLETGSLNYHKTKTFTRGEIEVTYNAKDANNTLGIAFCIDNNSKTSFYRDDDVSYYYLVVTVNGTLGLYRIKGGAATLLKNINTKNYYIEHDHVMKIVRDNNKVIHAFLDSSYCFSYVDKHPLNGDKFGLSSTSSKCVYKNISVKNTFSDTNDSIVDYDVVSGSFYKNNDLIVSDEANSMLIKKEPGTFNGTIQAEIALGKAYGSGVVFRVTKPNSKTFYENESGLSYYYLDIKSNNRIIFGKFVDGVKTWESEKYMPYFMSNAAKVKIVMKDNEIYAYFSNILVYHYTDNSPLTGLYYGLRSDSVGLSLKGEMTFLSSTTTETNQYLIFGHSYTQLWHQYKTDFAELGEDINDIGIGGSQTKNWAEQYQHETACYNPEWGIYWNGINDVDADIETAKIINYYKACLNSIKSEVPNFKCVVLSISRCCHEKALARFNQISDANAGIKEFCDENDWLVYVDVEKVFCDDEGQPIESFFVDKLHPTPAGYKLVAPLVVNAIKNF